MSKELAALLILIVPFIGSALVPILNLISRRAVPLVSVFVGLISAVIAFFLPAGAGSATQFSFEWLPGVLKTGFILDPLSVVPALIATWIGFLVLVYSLGYMKHEENLARYYSNTLLFIGSMVGMALADNFLALFFFWEVMGVCSYLLIGFFYRDPKAADAGAKAFITTKIGDVGLLASILILYSITGTFSIADNHLFSHAIFKALLFLCAGSVIDELGTRDIREMGRLQKYMPITGTTFFIGALALMGLPLLIGFFSKDLILEQALEHGSYAPLTVAALAALLTAFYSIRTTMMVFWGERRTEKHVHEASSVMTGPLTLLALGSIVSWLLVGNLTTAWKSYHLTEHTFNWSELMAETFSSHAFILTLIALVCGFVLFLYRHPIGNFLRNKAPVVFKAMAIGLGFDKLYGWFIKFVYWLGRVVRYLWDDHVMEGINKLVGWMSIFLSNISRKMQTGDIHWNLVYIILALIIIIGTILW